MVSRGGHVVRGRRIDHVAAALSPAPGGLRSTDLRTGKLRADVIRAARFEAAAPLSARHHYRKALSAGVVLLQLARRTPDRQFYESDVFILSNILGCHW